MSRLAFTHIIHNATQSTTATTILVLVVLLMFLNTVRGIAMTAARVLLAFGRDGMLPYGHVFAYTCYGEPVVGTLLTVAVSLVAGLVQLGPAAAFHSLLGSSTILSFMCYGTYASSRSLAVGGDVIIRMPGELSVKLKKS